MLREINLARERYAPLLTAVNLDFCVLAHLFDYGHTQCYHKNILLQVYLFGLHEVILGAVHA